MEFIDIKNLLHGRNFRLTQERKVVLHTFIKSGRMLTPAQLHELVTVQHSKVGLTTVYRLIEMLTKLSLATPFLIDGEIYYTFCSEQHHHHFVCLECHRVKDIFNCSSAIENQKDCGKIEYHRLDLYGYCEICEQQEGQQQC